MTIPTGLPSQITLILCTTNNYNYDANGNRTASHVHGTSYVIGPGNQLLSDGFYNYEYDTEGNMVRKTEIETGNVTIYQFDQKNRLVVVRESTSTDEIIAEESYVYAADDRRLVITTNGTCEYEVPYGNNVWSRISLLTSSVTYFGFSNGLDQVLVQMMPNGPSQFYLGDKSESVTTLLENGSSILGTRSYDSYGQTAAEDGSGVGPWYFQGRQWSNTTRLQFHRARYYDPTIGRFISPDPVGLVGDTNTYVFVSNSPPNATDPSGKIPIMEYLGALGLTSLLISAKSFVESTFDAAVQEAVSRGYPDINHGKGDAYKHCLTTLYVAAIAGPVLSFWAGWLHEIEGGGNTHPGDFWMDMHNNAIALGLYQEYSPTSWGECAGLCARAIDDGSLIWLTGPGGIWPDSWCEFPLYGVCDTSTGCTNETGISCH